MRNSYIHGSGLLSPALKHKEIYFRSTNMRRTVDSLRSAVGGLYPPGHGPSPITVYTADWDSEHLAPTAKPCPSLAETFRAGRSRFARDDTAGSTAEFSACLSAHNWDMSSSAATLSSLDRTLLGDTKYTLSSLRQKVAELTGTSAAEVNFVRLRDAMVAAAADGQPSPAGWDAELVRAIDAAGTRQLVAFLEGAAGVDTARAVRLSIGRMVQEVSLRLDQASFAHSLHAAAFGTEGQDHWSLPSWVTPDTYQALAQALQQQTYFPAATAGMKYMSWGAEHMPADASAGPSAPAPRVCLYSVHDSTIMPMLMALGVWDGQWPPFASTLAIELYSDAPGPAGMSVIPLNHQPSAAAGGLAEHKGHLSTPPAVLEALATAASGEDLAVEAIALEAARSLVPNAPGSPDDSDDDPSKDKAPKADHSIITKAADAVEAAVVAVEHSILDAAHALAHALLGSSPSTPSLSEQVVATDALTSLTSSLADATGLDEQAKAALDKLIDQYVQVATDLAQLIEQAGSAEAAQGLQARKDEILAEVRRLTGNENKAAAEMILPQESKPADGSPEPAHLHASGADTLPSASLDLAAELAKERAQMEGVMSAERARVEKLLSEEKERASAALAGTNKAVEDMGTLLGSVQEQLSKKVEDLRGKAERAFTWAAEALHAAEADSKTASEGVSKATVAAAAAVQHAKEATAITERAAVLVEKAVLAEAAAVAESLRASEAASAAVTVGKSAQENAASAAAAAETASRDAAAARQAASNLSHAAESASTAAQEAAQHAAAAEVAATAAATAASQAHSSATNAASSAGASSASAATATVHATASAADVALSTALAVEASHAVQAAMHAAEMAVAAARAAEESAATRAAELQVAAQRADLMAQVATARAEATRAIATAADIARKADAEAAKALTDAETAKVKAAAEAQVATQQSTEAKKLAAAERAAADVASAAARSQVSEVLTQAQADMERALRAMRLQEDEARQSVAATMAAIKQELASAIAKAEADSRAVQQEAERTATAAIAAAAEAKASAAADVALAEAVAAERSALALAVAQAESEAAARHVAEIRQRAEAESRAAQAESRALAAEALAETRRVAEEALLAQALAEELIAEAKRQIAEVKAEAAAVSVAAVEASARAKAAVEADVTAAIAAAEAVKAKASAELEKAKKQLQAEQARLAQQKRITETASFLSHARSYLTTAPQAAAVQGLDSGSKSEAAAAWVAMQLKQAEELALHVPSAVPAPPAPQPLVAPEPADPYVSKLVSARAQGAAQLEAAKVDSALPSVLRAMHLRDTPVNRVKARRYISTVGLDEAVAKAKDAEAQAAALAAASRPAAAKVFAPRVEGEAGYVAAALSTLQRSSKVVAAPPAPTVTASSAGSAVHKPSPTYMDLFKQAAVAQGMKAPLAEEAIADPAPAPVPAPVAASAPPSPTTLLDAAYLAGMAGLKSVFAATGTAAAVQAPAAPAVIQPVAAPRAAGEPAYLAAVAAAAAGLSRSHRAPAQAAPPSSTAADLARVPQTVTPAAPVGSGLYEANLVAATQALARAKAVKKHAHASSSHTSPTTQELVQPAPADSQLASAKLSLGDRAYLASLSSKVQGAKAHSVSVQSAPVPHYFVRVTYNGRVLPLPGSSGADMVPLETFRALLAAYIPKDYLAECGLRSSAPAAPTAVAWPHSALVEAALPALTASLAERVGKETLAAAQAAAPAALASLAAAGEDVAFDTIASDASDFKAAQGFSKQA